MSLKTNHVQSKVLYAALEGPRSGAPFHRGLVIMHPLKCRLVQYSQLPSYYQLSISYYLLAAELRQQLSSKSAFQQQMPELKSSRWYMRICVT